MSQFKRNLTDKIFEQAFERIDRLEEQVAQEEP